MRAAPVAKAPAIPAGPVAAKGANQVVLRGRVFTRLLAPRTKELEGLSTKCPECGASKDLHNVPSGLDEEEALNRLERWANACIPAHKLRGGRLLKDFAS